MRLLKADITKLEVDAIVNAANGALSGGGGVDGAIHRAAGPELLAECRTLGRCPPGEVRVTQGYRLPARLVFHAVGPVWRGGEAGETDQLAACYRHCMELAREHGVRSIAFPAISCGIYGFPAEKAAPIALGIVAEMLPESGVEDAIFVMFDPGIERAYERAFVNTQPNG
ncbi:O-acetyl-ADP-ribose deacetylase [Lacibacterium aquatile]|uniref:O-acetyl-ADP-ribose deacetylase n=1 Tax=Lacibacterium aquatile TaxID=1168082 RepID=A0ABW5DXC7_9PROT